MNNYFDGNLALEMPRSYVFVGQEEMEYIDGGDVGRNGQSAEWWGMNYYFSRDRTSSLVYKESRKQYGSLWASILIIDHYRIVSVFIRFYD
ncbi:MAG: hypothetical protein FWF88_03775 [Peptococcaceae bacterium]|nr:hypothetical protein [Peptococcaceae bacterium]